MANDWGDEEVNAWGDPASGDSVAYLNANGKPVRTLIPPEEKTLGQKFVDAMLPSRQGVRDFYSQPGAIAQKAGEGLLPGWNRLNAAFDAALATVVPQGKASEVMFGDPKFSGTDGFGNRYNARLQALQKQSDRSAQAAPIAAPVTSLVGALPTILATGQPLTAETALGRLGQASAQGAIAGGAYGYGDARAPLGTEAAAQEGLGGALTGALFGGAMQGAGELFQRGLRLPLPRLTKTPEAQRLEAEGVSGLTTGQMAPDSVLGIIERMSADSPLGLKPQREAAKLDWMRVAQNKGAAPGAEVPANPDLQGRLSELFKGFDPVYGQLKGAPIPPEAVAELPSAAAMPRKGVDARTSAGVRSEVENALTALGPKPQASAASGLLDASGAPIPAPEPPPMKATVGDLMKVRENIREQSRAASKSQDFDRLRLLNGAEDVVTEAIAKGLTPEQSAMLQQTDRQYARLMTAANAAPAGQTEFTPLQYLKQVEHSAGRRNFKRGEAGDLQDLGEAARQVFTDAPMTGVRPGILSAIPWGTKVGAPISRFANSPSIKAQLFRQEAIPSAPPTQALSPDIAAMLEAMLRRRPASIGFAPAAADNEQ